MADYLMNTLVCAFAEMVEMGYPTWLSKLCTQFMRSYRFPHVSQFGTLLASLRFFFFRLKAGDKFAGKGIPPQRSLLYGLQRASLLECSFWEMKTCQKFNRVWVHLSGYFQDSKLQLCRVALLKRKIVFDYELKMWFPELCFEVSGSFLSPW